MCSVFFEAIINLIILDNDSKFMKVLKFNLKSSYIESIVTIEITGNYKKNWNFNQKKILICEKKNQIG